MNSGDVRKSAENPHDGHIHWNENVVILVKFSSLATLEVVNMTTSSAVSDENFIKMTTASNF